MCVAATAFCNDSRCNYEECKRRVDKRNFVCRDMVLMSRGIKNWKEQFLKGEEAFESKGLKVNLKRPKWWSVV